MSSRHHRGHSRRSSSHRRDSNPVVTQSFEGLSLAETANAYSASDYPTYPPAFSLPIAEEESFVPDVTDMSHYYEMSTPPQGYQGGSSHGYTFPTTEVPLSRSLSGHSSHILPASILPSSLEEFADADRDISRQRRRRHARSRREHKTRTRRAGMLPPGDRDNQGSSLAGELSSSIDSLTAHHASAHGGPGYPFTSPDPNRSTYATTSSSYEYPASLYNTAPAYTSHYASGPSEHYRAERPRQPHDLSQATVVVAEPRRAQCWEHGCNGRAFSTFSNLLRHQREKSGTSHKSMCPRCGAEFTRKTARDGHMAHDKCKGGRNQGQ